jgi:hypothetical protein
MGEGTGEGACADDGGGEGTGEGGGEGASEGGGEGHAVGLCWTTGGERLRRGKGKRRLVKNNMARYDDARCGKVHVAITLMMR